MAKKSKYDQSRWEIKKVFLVRLYDRAELKVKMI